MKSKYHIRYTLLLTFWFVNTSNILAQQGIQNSQYMFNLFAINPAYAGSKGVLVANVSYRNQWTGFKGAPISQSVSIHAPITKYKIGIGLEVANDQIGPRTLQTLNTAYAYRFKIGTGKIGFGLKTGIYNYTYDWTQLHYEDQTDVVIGNGKTSKIVPNFNFGSYYYDRVHYFGFELSNLTRAKIYSNDFLPSKARLYPNLSIFGAKAFEINEKLVIKTSFLARKAKNVPGYADINVSAFYNKKIWLGASYRTNKVIVIIAQYYISETVRIGYSYDLSLNKLSTIQAGSHEIYLGFDLNVFKSKTLSPRYF